MTIEPSIRHLIFIFKRLNYRRWIIKARYSNIENYNERKRHRYDFISRSVMRWDVKIVTLSRDTIVSIFVKRKLIEPSRGASKTSK